LIKHWQAGQADLTQATPRRLESLCHLLRKQVVGRALPADSKKPPEY
jgi:hypothetical protein